MGAYKPRVEGGATLLSGILSRLISYRTGDVFNTPGRQVLRTARSGQRW